MIGHSIDNISYARDLFSEKRHTSRTVGEHVIEKDALDTILGLICLGFIPETISVETYDNDSKVQILVPKCKKFILNAIVYERRLASYPILKDFKFRTLKNDIKVYNIDIVSILKILSSGTTYKSVTKSDNDYIMKLY